jgi:hypothetical protein
MSCCRATGDYSYRRIGARYGRNENAISQFAFDNKDAIAKERARLHQQLELHLDGRLRYGTRILEQIIEEINERIGELEEIASPADLRYLSGQAAWLNYHAAWCRYQELQADIVRQIVNEVDPRGVAVGRSPRSMVVSYSTLFVRDAGSRFLRLALLRWRSYTGWGYCHYPWPDLLLHHDEQVQHLVGAEACFRP